MGEIPFVPFLVEVLQLRTGMLGMLREVEVRAVGHTLQLSIAWRVKGKRYSTSNVPHPSLA